MKVYMSGRNQYLLAWEKGESEGPVDVLVADQLGGNYESVGTSPPDANQFVWDPSERSSDRREWFFKIDSSAGERGPVRVTGKRDRYAVEAARLAKRHLQRDISTKGYLFERPTEGERCETCWDEVRQQSVRSNCPECGGSGYKKGYAPPVELFVSYASTPQAVEQFPTMRFEQGQIACWTSNETLVREGDYLVRERDLELLEVVRWQPTMKRAYIIRQNMMTRVVEEADVRQGLIEEVKPFLEHGGGGAGRS